MPSSSSGSTWSGGTVVSSTASTIAFAEQEQEVAATIWAMELVLVEVEALARINVTIATATWVVATTSYFTVALAAWVSSSEATTREETAIGERACWMRTAKSVEFWEQVRASCSGSEQV